MSVGEVEGEGSLREASWARSDASVAGEVEEEAEAEAEEVSMEELSLEPSLEASDDEELREMQGAVARLREQRGLLDQQALGSPTAGLGTPAEIAAEPAAPASAGEAAYEPPRVVTEDRSQA